MAQMKTPGVYLKEKDAFPNSVVEVATAVPAFIGFTEKAQNGTQSLNNKPFRISSFAEYMLYFGGSSPISFTFKKGTQEVKGVKAVAKVAAVAEVKNAAGVVTTPAVPAKPAVAAVQAVAPDGNYIFDNVYYKLEQSGDKFRMFDAIRFFYQNGGGPCYIVSVGNYENGISKGLLDGTDTKQPGMGLPSLEKEQEPTMVLVPDALSLEAKECYSVYEQVVAHCTEMKSRVAILDVYNGYKDLKNPESVIEKFRDGVGMNGLKYATVYYPWVNTTIVQDTEISFNNIETADLDILKGILGVELIDNYPNAEKPETAASTKLIASSFTPGAEISMGMDGKIQLPVGSYTLKDGTVIKVKAGGLIDTITAAGGGKAELTAAEIQLFATSYVAGSAIFIGKDATGTPMPNGDFTLTDGRSLKVASGKISAVTYVQAQIASFLDKNLKSTPALPADQIDATLTTLSNAYKELIKEMLSQLNNLPPSSAMAGVYTMVDATRGVWKAPANVSLNSVVSPAVNITHADQEDLNMPLNGKAVNAIRSFVGEGVIVWGARTLDGNSQDWRYINVRRTIIMLEQSVKAASKAYVFEPNDAGTWTTIKSMIENFLHQQWKNGALVGSKPGEAFSVHVGLGDTMSGDDILNGIMRITVLIAVSRPAEFIEITFQQQMQKS